ncbi:MAG: VTT domain-containing protein [Deltaproteobacteria bacterium]
MVIAWIKYLIINYGLLAIFIGTFFDSESAVLILGGITARLGYLYLLPVIILSYLGVFGGDQLYFWLGRWKGEAILSKWPWLKRKVDHLEANLGGQKILKILIFRFILGLRIPAPFFLGMSGVSYRKFVVVDALLLLPWAVGLCLAGYLLGELVKKILIHVTHYQYLILGVIIGLWVIILVGIKIYHSYRK